jgi:hypothetical protein
MRYTVTWLPDAQNELARLWMQAADRQAMSAASNRIDQLLARVPLSVGTAQGSDYRLVVGPLEVVYTVSPPDCFVEVIYIALLP